MGSDKLRAGQQREPKWTGDRNRSPVFFRHLETPDSIE